MPLGAYSGNASGEFYSGGRNRQNMDSTTGNHSRGAGASGGRPVKKLGVVAKAVAATMSVDRLQQGVARTQKDLKNGKISVFSVFRRKPIVVSNDYLSTRFGDIYTLFRPSCNFCTSTLLLFYNIPMYKIIHINMLYNMIMYNSRKVTQGTEQTIYVTKSPTSTVVRNYKVYVGQLEIYGTLYQLFALFRNENLSIPLTYIIVW